MTFDQITKSLFTLALCVVVSAQDPNVIENQTFADTASHAINVTTDGTIVRNCRIMNCFSAIRIANCKNVTIEDCEITGCRALGILITGDSVENVTIRNCKISGWSTDLQGGHFLQTSLREGTPYRNISIIGNRLIGNEQSWVPGTINGAAGDMLVFRSARDVEIRNNELSGGGEFGMSFLYGSRNVMIEGNTVKRIEGTGLLVGYDVANVKIKNNRFIDCGMDWDGSGQVTHQSGVHCRNGAANVQLSGNTFIRREAPQMSYGLHAREASISLESDNQFMGKFSKLVHIPAAFLPHTRIDWVTSQGTQAYRSGLVEQLSERHPFSSDPVPPSRN